MNVLIVVSTIVSALATVFIAMFSYRSYLLAKEIDESNQLAKKEINKVYWALVVSNCLRDTNKSILKEHFGLLATLFGYENLKKQIGFNDQQFEDIANKNFGNSFNEIVENNKNKD